MPAARRQSSKKSLLRCLFVKMKGLGIEFGRKSLNLRLGDAQSTGAEGLPHCEIFEVSLAHSNELLPAVTHRKARVAVSFVRSPSKAKHKVVTNSFTAAAGGSHGECPTWQF